MDHLIAKASASGHGLSSVNVADIYPVPSLSAADDSLSRSVQTVFGALATDAMQGFLSLTT
jgi:hypothetical protein